MRQHRSSSSSHTSKSWTLLLVLLLIKASLPIVHSYSVAPWTPFLTRDIQLTPNHGTSESLGTTNVFRNSFVKNVQYSRPRLADSRRTRTSLKATRKRDALKQAYRNILSNVHCNILSKLSKAFKIVTLSLTLLLATLLPPAHADSSGGRMGGSFGYSSSYSSSSTTGSYSSTRLSYQYSDDDEDSLDLVTAMALYGAVVYYEERNKDSDDSEESPLGPGISVLKFSVALDLPDRDDTAGILHFLKHASKTVSMDSRENVSSFVSNVCQELKQQHQSNIFAACATHDHFSNVHDAERQASTLSIEERSKFELETNNKFGGRYQSNDILRLEEQEMDESMLQETQSTCAIVTIVLLIKGDQTQPSTTMNSWQDVKDGLSLISEHVVKEDCLLSAEVLWTPERRRDIWAQRDIASFYPDLRMI